MNSQSMVRVVGALAPNILAHRETTRHHDPLGAVQRVEIRLRCFGTEVVRGEWLSADKNGDLVSATLQIHGFASPQRQARAKNQANTQNEPR